jgi:flagellar biosynthesis protein FliQ
VLLLLWSLLLGVVVAMFDAAVAIIANVNKATATDDAAIT